MKIGLIGINMYPKYLNFACPLHTYAFQQFLLQHGIESTVIDYKPVYFNNFDMRHPADYYKKRYEQLSKKIVNAPKEIEQQQEELDTLQQQIHDWDALYEEREIRYEKFQQFIDKNYIKTPEKYDSDLLEIIDPGFDCYICVTDVIWGLLPTHTYDRGFFLASKAMDGKQKISYAASRGVPKEYTDEEKELFFYYLQDIDAISVREKSLKDFIENNSQKEATLVLDPVLLQPKSFWQKHSIKPIEEKYIVLYYVMEKATDTIKRAVEYAKQHDLLIIELSDRPEKNGRVNDKDVKHIAKYAIGMEEWLGYIEHAECIFTNSFHGCCFSIIFEKLFYVGNRKGDKVTNLLEAFNLQNLKLPTNTELKVLKTNRSLLKKGLSKLGLLKPISSNIFDMVPKAIDYSCVNRILNRKRAESQHFILTAIANAEKHYLANMPKDKILDYDEYRKQILFSINYHSGKPGASNTYDLTQPGSYIKTFPIGTSEYSLKSKLYKNDGTSAFEKNKFILDGYRFTGWTIRIKIDTKWFWYMKDGSLGSSECYGDSLDENKMQFSDGSKIPYIPSNRIRLIVAEAHWKKLK